jgi:hypothetical protein
VILIIIIAALRGVALVVHRDAKLLDELVGEIAVVDLVETLQTETSALHRSTM